MEFISGTRTSNGRFSIEGDERFTTAVEEAKNLLGEHPEFYELVRTYLETVVQCSPWIGSASVSPAAPCPLGRDDYGGWMWVHDQNILSSPERFGAYLVNRAYHAKLFYEDAVVNDRFPPGEVWDDGPGQVKSDIISIKFLEAVGAPSISTDGISR